jgi:hypothetical protein
MIPLIQLLYPRMCELRLIDPDLHRRRTILLCMGVGSAVLLLSGGLFVSREALAVSLAGPEIQHSVALHLGELSFMLLPVAVSGIVGNLYVLACAKDAEFNIVVTSAAVLGVALLVGLPLTNLRASGASLALVVAELVAALGMLFVFFRGRK